MICLPCFVTAGRLATLSPIKSEENEAAAGFTEGKKYSAKVSLYFLFILITNSTKCPTNSELICFNTKRCTCKSCGKLGILITFLQLGFKMQGS